MKLTEFGKLARKYRIDAEIKLKTMAEAIGVSISYLSALETGKKAIPDTVVDKAIAFFKQYGIDAHNLREAADKSKNEFKINMQNLNPDSRALVAAFARKFPELSPDRKAELAKLLEQEID